MFFRPSITLTLILLALALVFFRLGQWQSDRKAEKILLFDEFRNAPLMTVEQALQSDVNFARVGGSGRYDSTRHILLDNKILNGRAGVHVLTPFTLADGSVVLVNRGWLFLAADRRSLPKVNTPRRIQLIKGIMTRPAEAGHRVGKADQLDDKKWPQLMTYFDLPSISEALGVRLQPMILMLDPDDLNGFEGRNWQPAVMGPDVHGAYAVQWYALAGLSLVIWIVMGVSRAKKINGAET